VGKRRISERPAHVQLRRSIGHWEGDTVMGADQRHCVLTLVERVAGYLLIKKTSAKSSATRVATELNNRPRNRLGFRTPSEAFARS
jgi:IS30 family transposase